MAEPLYLSSVIGQVVQRYGTKTLLGCERDPADPSVVSWRPELVVAISADEARRFAKEYRRAVTAGSLVTRTAAEWRAQQEPIQGRAADPPPDPPQTKAADSVSSKAKTKSKKGDTP